MYVIERHERIQQLAARIDDVGRRRAEANEEYDRLWAEYEILIAECFDEECPCTEQADGDNRPVVERNRY